MEKDGRGRKPYGAKLHPDRPCGPVCQICKAPASGNRYTHSAYVDDWQDLHHTPVSINLASDDCLCHACLKRLRRGPSKENVGRTCSVACCKEHAHTQVSPNISAAMISERLGEEVDTHMSTQIALCNTHYTAFYGKHVCGICHIRLSGTRPRSSPNFMVVSQAMKQSGIVLKQEDKYCQTCYKAQLKMLQLSESAQSSTDHQLRSLIAGIQQERKLAGSVDEALALTTVMVAECLLANESLLLSTAYDHFKACLNREEKNARWLLSNLVSDLGHHLQHSSLGKGRKSGTVLLRSGCDMKVSLWQSLSRERTHYLQQQRDEFNIESAQSTKFPVQKSFLTTVIQPVAEIFHDRLHAQAVRFKGREHSRIKELCDVQLASVIDEIDDDLWKCVWSMLYGSKSVSTSGPLTAHEHTMKMRCQNASTCTQQPQLSNVLHDQHPNQINNTANSPQTLADTNTGMDSDGNSDDDSCSSSDDSSSDSTDASENGDVADVMQTGLLTQLQCREQGGECPASNASGDESDEAT